MNEQVTMSVGVALVLGEVTKMLLYKKDGDTFIDRDLPFRLKYRLNKNKMILDKDASIFNQKRLIALSKYGTMTEDGENVVITDEKNKELFQKEVSDLIDSTVTHQLSLLDPSDIDLVKDTDMPISPEAMSIFIGYMVDDPSLKEDVVFKVRISDKLPKEENENEKAVNKVKEPVVEEPEVSVVENPVAEKPAKKTRAKKTTETKEVKEKKTTTKKKTTSKKEKVNG